jgi:hypothetical protein
MFIGSATVALEASKQRRRVVQSDVSLDHETVNMQHIFCSDEYADKRFLIATRQLPLRNRVQKLHRQLRGSCLLTNVSSTAERPVGRHY